MKVKSHSGVPLNEDADWYADTANMDDPVLLFQPSEAHSTLRTKESNMSIKQVRKTIAERVRGAQMQELKLLDSINSRTLFIAGSDNNTFRLLGAA